MEAAFCAERLRQCTREEKLECLETYQKLYRYGRTSRMKGLLALEDLLGTESNPLLREGLMHVVDSWEPELVERALTAFVLSGDLRGGPFLDAMLVMEGVRMIQAGTNPRQMAALLRGWFGLDFQAECLQALDALERADRAEEPVFPAPPEAPASCEEPEFDLLCRTSPPCVQRLLRDVDLQDLACALLCASQPVRDVIMDALSLQSKAILREELFWVRRCPPKHSAEAQRRILATAKKLESCGELILTMPYTIVL